MSNEPAPETGAEPWPVPSPSVAELIRSATTRLLLEPDKVFQDVDGAVLASQPGRTTADPRVTDAIRASNRANLAHWATANIRDPGARVAPSLGPETLEIAREIVRRGLDDTSLSAYRVGQNIAWRHWMRTAFELTADPDELREMLDITARSIFTFVDETLAVIHEEMERERAQLGSRTHTERLEIVNLILEHAPITSERASSRLRYELKRSHTAAIIWSDVIGPRDPGELEAAADALTRVMGASRPLTVAPSADSLWVWFVEPGPDARSELEPDLAVAAGGVRIALGSPAAGLDGFRRSHLQALVTQTLMRRMPAERRLAAYSDVRLVALAAHDQEAAGDFVSAILGGLAGADPELRETLRTYIREGFSVARTAQAMYTHRNTVTGRVNRAEELLAVPLASHGLEVGLALEIVHWLGPLTPESRTPALPGGRAGAVRAGAVRAGARRPRG